MKYLSMQLPYEKAITYFKHVINVSLKQPVIYEFKEKLCTNLVTFFLSILNNFV